MPGAVDPGEVPPPGPPFSLRRWHLNYEFKTEPFRHQAEEFALSGQLPVRALFWEQGTGKTKPVIDSAAQLFEDGRIDALVVIAPNGVHRNWIVDQLPEHLPERVMRRARLLEWRTGRADTKKAERERDALAEHQGLAIVALSYNALMTDVAVKWLKKFMIDRRAMAVLDESQYAKAPRTQRTKRVLSLGPYAPFRRILTGTPCADKPFDVYAQLKFLDLNAWRPLGIGNFATFKSYFGVFQKAEIYRAGKRVELEQLTSYRNLEDMNAVMRKYGSRLLKSDVLDLPEKLYTKRYFDLSPVQRQVYEQLTDEYFAMLPSGESVTADLAVTRQVRLEQCVSGWLPTDQSEPKQAISKDMPRLDVLRELVNEVEGKAIIWAKWTEDVNRILAMLAEEGFEAVRYDGLVSDDDRGEAIERFRRGTARFFVSKPSVGGSGLTLVEATTVVYYNNRFKLDERLQSEDRAHRIGQKSNVLYVDIVASGTVDEWIVNRLREKRQLAAVVQGDEVRAWI